MNMTYTKIKFFIILIFFPRMNNKKIMERGLKKFKKMGKVFYGQELSSGESTTT